MKLRNVSDTARWVALYRALESERPDALFHDPFARTLAGDRGAALLESIPGGRAMAWAMAVRTAVFDQLICAAVGSAAIDVVVNLGAGLCTRPYRLALPRELRWIEIDLPEILDEKRVLMAPHRAVCALESLSLDVTDAAARRATLARIAAGARAILVVTEGLLVYLAPEDVAALATEIHAEPQFARWITDLASPWFAATQARRWNKPLAQAHAPWRFAPADGLDFFRAYGWHAIEARSAFLEGRRLARTMRGDWLVRLAHWFGPSRWHETARDAAQYAVLARVELSSPV